LKRMQFWAYGHPYAGGDADVSRVSCPFYERIDWNTERNFALEVENLGFDSISLPDHLSVGAGGTTLENWTTVTNYLALTKRIRAGPFALSNGLRYPSIVARMISTLDIISGGRLNVGIGAGWKRDEYEQYGIPFPSYDVRVERLREGLIIMKKLWTEEKATFKGKYYSINEAILAPKPIQKPHPPLFIPGGGERILKVVAELGDGMNYQFTPDLYRERLALLDKFCLEVGRNYKEVKKSWQGHVVIAKDPRKVEEIGRRWYKIMKTQSRSDAWVKGISSYEDLKQNIIMGTPEECVEKVERYQEAGAEILITHFTDFPSMDGVRLFAKEVIPHFR